MAIIKKNMINYLQKNNINEGEIHIWIVNMLEHYDNYNDYLHLLSSHEYKRANNYAFEKDKQRFVISRGILKTLIAKYLLICPKQVRLSINKYGKPYIKKINNLNKMLHFNVSHSENIILYIFSEKNKVGIDIEKPKIMNNLDNIAKMVFTDKEYHTFMLIPKLYKSKFFYQCWSRKEAFIKALGTGLAYPLNKVNVIVIQKKYMHLISVGKFKIMDLHIDPNYTCAFAVKGEIKKTYCIDYTSFSILHEYAFD